MKNLVGISKMLGKLIKLQELTKTVEVCKISKENLKMRKLAEEFVNWWKKSCTFEKQWENMLRFENCIQNWKTI